MIRMLKYKKKSHFSVQTLINVSAMFVTSRFLLNISELVYLQRVSLCCEHLQRMCCQIDEDVFLLRVFLNLQCFERKWPPYIFNQINAA